MGEDEDKKLNSIVPAPSRGIIRAGLDSLARRGLQELTIGARWTGKRIFSDTPGIVAISSLGLIATDWKNDSQESHSIAIYKPEADQCSIITSQDFPLPVHCFAWSPCGRYLLSKFSEYGGPLRLYDAVSGKFLSVVGYDECCRSVRWSPNKGNHVAIASDDCSLRIWDIEQEQGKPPGLVERVEIDLNNWPRGEFLDKYGDHLVDTFHGFSHPVFSPDETSLAVSTEDWLEDISAELRGEEEEGVEDDVPSFDVHSIVAFDVATLRQQFRVEIPDSPDSVSWASNGHLIVCCGDEVYSIEPRAAQLFELPIRADICRCHPLQNICAFAEQQWPNLRSGSDDRLFVVNLTDLKTLAEKPAVGGIRDLAWSLDGKALYALSGDGHLWTAIIPSV